jgi:phage terminase Nu1 subunit (DNA packaging protein)
MAKRRQVEPEPDELKGWQQIAAFLGQPVAVAQRWAKSGMPVEKRGRSVYSSRKELNRWLGRESAGEPVQIATGESDLSAELKRGLSFFRKQHRTTAKTKAA